MILIGLFGGLPKSRDEIARVLMNADPMNIGVYALNASDCASGAHRAERLNVVLQGLNAKVQGSSLVISHVLSVEEAQTIRNRGGHLWHVMGEPCETIAIQKGDTPVTAFVGGCRHFLDPLEAYSEVMLAHGRAR